MSNNDKQYKATILLAEDEETTRRPVVDYLSESGFKVLEASNGDEALKLAIENKPDLILLDVIMPKMNGIEVLKKLREDKWGKDAKVILLTNLSGSDTIAQAVAYNVKEYFLKSEMELSDIVEKINAKLNLK